MTGVREKEEKVRKSNSDSSGVRESGRRVKTLAVREM